jgi:hypothetical protein
VDLPQQEEYFKKYYERLILEALHARAHLNLWERFEKYKASDYIDELNQARYFFNFTIKAHLDDLLLTLSRILDRHDESLSIWKFLDFIEQNLKLFSADVFQHRMKNNPYYDSLIESHIPITTREIDADRQKLIKLELTVNNLATWRDKVIAHIDRQFVLSERIVSEAYPLQLQQLKEISETFVYILNRYSGAFNSSSYAESYIGEDDVQFVMDCMRFYSDEQNKQLEALKSQLKIKKKESR